METKDSAYLEDYMSIEQDYKDLKNVWVAPCENKRIWEVVSLQHNDIIFIKYNRVRVQFLYQKRIKISL